MIALLLRGLKLFSFNAGNISFHVFHAFNISVEKSGYSDGLFLIGY
jgi:hypothetical protein